MEQNNIYKTVFKVTHSGGSGSCFYLKAYDLFVTNYHVTEGFRTVAIHDNERNPYLAKVVLANPAMDIALLAAEGDFSSLPDISLAEDDTLTIGRKVYVAGYPYGMPFTITEGSVSSPKQLMDGKYYIQTDAAVNPGNSGGPILDEDTARRKMCGGFQRRLPGIVCRITTCIKEAARQTVPPITIQPVENCAADSNPRCPAPAENVRRITTPPAAEKNAAGVGTNGTV